MADDPAPQPDAPRPGAPAPPPAPEAPAFYGRKPRRRWPWVLVLVVALVVASGAFAVHQRSSRTAASATASAAPASVVPAAPGEQPTFALPGAGDAVVFLQSATAIQRGDLTTGAGVLTPTLALQEPSSFFAGPGWVASKSTDRPDGVLVRDGGAAQLLPPVVQQAGRAFRGDSGGIWVVPQQQDRDGGRTATLVDVNGDPVDSTRIRIPGKLGLPSASLAGSLLSVTLKGTFQVTPTGSRPVSGGVLLGVGTDALLTWGCNKSKSCDARLDRAGQDPQYLPAARKSILGLYPQGVASAAKEHGALSPDRRWIALTLPKATRSGSRLVLVKLGSGHRIEVPGSVGASGRTDQAAWTPNGRYLLVLTAGRLRAVDTTTDKVVTIGGTPAGLLHLTMAGTATM